MPSIKVEIPNWRLTLHLLRRLSPRSTAYFLAFSALCLMASSRLPAQTPSAAATNPIQLKLTSKIDSKSSKVGDEVIAKTTSKMDFGGVSFPSGSPLVGKISAAGHQPSSVTIEFDSLQRKGQPATPVQAAIVAVAPPPEDSSSMSLPTGKAGYVNPNPVSSKESNDASDLTSPGSSVKNVTLQDNTLTSSKDFKLSSGFRMAVTLAAPAK
jgi:hypothetical protein